jgi:ADP-heptose:LPS heptosyltransferase
MPLNKILISRTDSIGDVVLSLPICAWLKEHNPQVQIYFLARDYTQAVVEAYTQVDYFISWDMLSKKSKTARADYLYEFDFDCIVHVFPRKEIARAANKAKIPLRIGTSHRLYHFLNCNQKVNFTRKKSDLHESQLNFELLRPLDLQKIPSMAEIDKMMSFFKPKGVLESRYFDTINSPLKKVILHPKSQGSAIEWGIENFIALAKILAENKCKVYFSGTEPEGLMFRGQLPVNENIIDISGKFSLAQFILFIKEVDALVAASTGPLHIAGALGKHAIGLYSMRKPIHPGRWQALGTNSEALVHDVNCENCQSGKECSCIQAIPPEEVAERILHK